MQFYEAYPGRARPRLRVVLSWTATVPTSICTWWRPTGSTLSTPIAWWRTARARRGCHHRLRAGDLFQSDPPAGTYLVYVNYYGSGARREAITVAQVAVITDENTLDERQQVFRVPMRKPGELTLVKSFVMR